MKNIFEGFENYIEAREFIITMLLAGLFLFLSFVGHTRLTMTEITDKWGQKYNIHISYYGFPFEMIGILNPLTSRENYVIQTSGISILRIEWVGLFLNFVLYFFLALALVYSFRRLKS